MCMGIKRGLCGESYGIIQVFVNCVLGGEDLLRIMGENEVR